MDMEKVSRYKSKNKNPANKTKIPKKKKSDGPTCSMFLTEIARKLASKKKEEQESKNIVQTIITSITNALPITFSRRSPEAKTSPIKPETLTEYAPELLPNDMIEIPIKETLPQDDSLIEVTTSGTEKTAFKIPKMPLISSEVLKVAADRRRKKMMRDASVNTGGDHDMAEELVKHMGTLKNIMLIAEEFNMKAAKNLKGIVDSVQEDLVQKLIEVRQEQKQQQQSLKICEEETEPPEENE